PLLLALAYLHVQDAPDGMMTFFFFSIRRKYLPGCMLLVAFLMAGPQEALKQAFGLVAAHLYDFLTRIWPSYGRGTNPIHTPRIVQQWFAKPIGASTTRSYGTAFQGRPVGSVGAQSQASSSRSGGWTSGFTSGSWGSRGPGRRLGDVHAVFYNWWAKVLSSKTYSSRDSHVVTHRSTNLPFNCLCMAERTGCPVFS
ncbi:hypothetical protein KCU78_g23941, partial [Aureobasidium melanogenum]